MENHGYFVYRSDFGDYRYRLRSMCGAVDRPFGDGDKVDDDPYESACDKCNHLRAIDAQTFAAPPPDRYATAAANTLRLQLRYSRYSVGEYRVMAERPDGDPVVACVTVTATPCRFA